MKTQPDSKTLDKVMKKDYIPIGGGRPVTLVNLEENTFLSDATTPLNLPSSCPSKLIKDHESSLSSHSNLPIPNPNLLSTPEREVYQATVECLK